ncbi:beta-galactosidase [Tenacibaculum sp. M341]|uniref:beta-galactosidase n=1 Tax=Tenacibaculum sp. M341 TaxID=2530339 RepID=UPI00104C5142|nr:beta-galactosidase [Tenacibaculum sp. M341]TCI94172.1 beta-agarase [Tenacibaculum sp. M341]
MKTFFQYYVFLMVSILMFTNCETQKKDHNIQNKEHKLMLFDFENIQEKSRIQPQDATFEFVEEASNNYIKVNNGFTIKEPGVKLLAKKEAPWDLSSFFQVKADVKNIGEEDIQVEMFVGNDPNLLLRWYCSDYVDLKPGESKTIIVDLAWSPWINKPQIEFKGMNGAPGKIKADLTKVTEITFNSRYAMKQNNFTVDNVRAEGKYEEKDSSNFFPFVDEFGQYKHADWKGKMHSTEELQETANKELAILNGSKGAPNIGKYGGWTAGPKLKATGFFRTEKLDGKWWMVDPEGYLFWTAGLNCVSSSSVATGITDRESYFSSMPNKEEKLGQFYQETKFVPNHGFYFDKVPYTTYNFYQSNLYRKYGDAWKEKFQDIAHKRIKDWGMNTIGFMSDFGATRQGRTPYVGSIWIKETPKILASKGYWGPMHDVFDPDFRKAVKESILAQKEGANDPWCIGYFIDNELSWGLLGSLSVGTLKSPKTQPAKIQFIQDLKEKYQDIKNLNKVWGSAYTSWDQMLELQKAPNKELAKDDLVTFYRKIADTYFKTIYEEIKKVAPNQNYLGCRFAWANNDVVLSTASKYLDIMSFNKYEYSVEKFTLPKEVDKPVMIGEFHFGATDRGSFHVGVKKAKTQEERGQMYQDYIQGALRNPYIIGAHWFQYIDEPNTGRFDGENYNVGFIDVCDNPFEEVIEKVKETTYNMYEYRRDNHSK